MASVTDLRRLRKEDDGIGLILVIGVSVVVFGLVATALTLAVNALGASQQRSFFESSLASAEDGIDTTLARLQYAYDSSNADFPVPMPQASNPDTACNASEVSAWDSSSGQSEDAWAQTQLTALADAHPECLETNESGQFITLKPPSATNSLGTYTGFGRVYSMGWAPEKAAARSVSRVIKVEYIFLPYAPSHAILTQADLSLSASTLVTTAAGFDTALAAVHSNGSITTSLGNPTVYGPVSSTGSSSATSNRFYANPGGAVISEPTVGIPTVSASAFYAHAPNNDATAVTTSGWWHDLCPDGSIREYSTNGPCDPLANEYAGLTGLSYDAGDHKWIIGRNADPGVYFAHQADVDVGTGNTSFTNMTVIASALNLDSCSSATSVR